MWLLKISLILVDSLLKVGPGKTKKCWKSPWKVVEFSHKKGVWTLSRVRYYIKLLNFSWLIKHVGISQFEIMKKICYSDQKLTDQILFH
jgi:hypothetical protein